MATRTKSRPAASGRSNGKTRKTSRPTGGELHLRGRLFDGTGTDRDVRLSEDVVERLTDRQILWVDAAEADEDEIEALAALFELEKASVAALLHPAGRPRVDLFGDYVQLYVNTLRTENGGERETGIAMIAGPNFVVTIHREPVDFLEAFREHLKGDTMIGLTDAPSFVAALLEWHLTGYFRVVEDLEESADRLDHRALHPRSERDLLADLVRLRRRISGVRRVLTPHREVYAALTRPDLTGLAESEAATHFRALVDRLERAIDAVEIARELVLGSFDVHMTRTAQRTNDVMKILTLVTVILLPGSLIAGVMGMNFRVGFFEDSTNFLLVVAAMGAIAVGTLAIARMRRWI